MTTFCIAFCESFLSTRQPMRRSADSKSYLNIRCVSVGKDCGEKMATCAPSCALHCKKRLRIFPSLFYSVVWISFVYICSCMSTLTCFVHNCCCDTFKKNLCFSNTCLSRVIKFKSPHFYQQIKPL